MGIYLQILQMQSTPESKDVIAQLGATAQNISTLVEQLLEVSRIETGHLDVKMENVNVTELFNELAAEFAPVAATKGFFFLTRPLPLTVYTDPLFVKRILTNLITNAIRYSQKPGCKIVLRPDVCATVASRSAFTIRDLGLLLRKGTAFSMRFTVVKRAKLLKPAMVSDFQL